MTRKDINEIQLAKAANHVGVEILLHEAGITSDQINEFVVARAFGTYLDIASTIRTGMFPPLPLDRFKQVGMRPALEPDRCWCQPTAALSPRHVRERWSMLS